MQKRAVRFTLLALLLVAGGGAVFVAWDTAQRLEGITSAERAATGQLDRIVEAATSIAAAQHAYVAPGQLAQPAFDRVDILLQQITSDIGAAAPLLRSPQAADSLSMLSDATAALGRTDAQVRTNVQFQQQLIAADLVFGEAAQTAGTIASRARSLLKAEMASAADARTAAVREAAMPVGITAALWALGLILFARVPRQQAAVPAAMAIVDAPAPVTAEPHAPASAPSIHLEAAAELCRDLSRLTNTAQVSPLLARAAAILDASGLIVWMGAGEELFAACSHGYDERVIHRLGPINRQADNATAAAWRSGETVSVAGDMVTDGAVVAPMFGPDNCVGVLAAEVRHGREADPGTRAVAGMIAAQLATALSAWPAPSVAEPAAPVQEAARA